ncbi:response regulator [Hyphomonas chukchiensis]|nr:response regulator [Hyphomonas chukchiensis]
MTHMTKPPQILIVEDEILIAMDLEDMVAEMGGAAVASAHTIQAAMKLAESIEADAAILDVDVAGQLVFPVADILAARGIPFLFNTGHSAEDILRSRYQSAPICRKPTLPRQLKTALKQLLASKNNSMDNGSGPLPA